MPWPFSRVPGDAGPTAAPVRAAGTTRSRMDRASSAVRARSARRLPPPCWATGGLRCRGRRGSRSPRRRPRASPASGRRRAALRLGAGDDLAVHRAHDCGARCARPRPSPPGRRRRAPAPGSGPPSSRPGALVAVHPDRHLGGDVTEQAEAVRAVDEGAAVVGVRVGHVPAVGDGETQAGVGLGHAWLPSGTSAWIR